MSTPPKHSGRRQPAVTQGRFIDYGDYTVLVDELGNMSTLDYVRIIPGLWGGKEEGVQKLPRPWLYDEASGTVIEEGDTVLVFYLNDSPQTPVVFGCARAIGANEVYDQDHRGAEVNRWYARVASQVAGVVSPTGVVEAEVLDGALSISTNLGTALSAGTSVDVSAGTEVNVRGTTSAELSAGADGGGVASIKVTLASGKTTVTLAGALSPEPVVKGTSMLGDLQLALTELAAAPTALGLPTTNTLTMIASIAASLALGAPYLSTTLESE